MRGILLLFPVVLIGGIHSQPDCLCFKEFENLATRHNPIIFRHSKDGLNRRFIGDQTGLVYEYDENDQPFAEPFLNVTDLVYTSGELFDENGLIQMEFHPNYANDPRIFIYYSIELLDIDCTIDTVTTNIFTRISEITVDTVNNKADLDTLRDLIDICQPFDVHQGGDLLFDENGYLLLFTGDGGGGDPFNLALDVTRLQGKTLRIDIDDPGTADRAYGIPEDNPYIGVERARHELYTIGWRNAWRADSDPGESDGTNAHRIIVADVGEDTWEEFNFLISMANYGWSAWEADRCHKSAQCDVVESDPNFSLPFYQYAHQNGNQCVIGGHMYRGCEFPDMYGYYFYGDCVSGKLAYLTENIDQSWTATDIGRCDVCPEGTIRNYETTVLSFGRDEAGDMYLLSSEDGMIGNDRGHVYKLIDPNRWETPCPPTKKY